MTCPLCKKPPVLFEDATECPRCAMRAPGHARLAPEYGPRGPLHLVLVACAKEKLDRAAPAGALYVSPLFRKAWRWACTRPAAEPFILSARHGLLDPRTVVEPYDLELRQLSRAERDGWAQYVTRALVERARGHAPVRVTILAGASYVEPLRPHLPPSWVVEEPLAGLQVGQRLAWFTREAA